MNDISSKADAQGWARDTNELDEIAEGRDSTVILTHPSPERAGLSLGDALTWALRGDTTSFNAVVGFFGHNTVADSSVDLDEPGDDPASIIIREGEEGFEPAAEDSVGFRLMTGSFFSPAAELAGRTWYWICRWKRERPEEAKQFQNAFNQGARQDFRGAAEDLFDPQSDGSLPLVRWTNSEASAALGLSNEDEKYWSRGDSDNGESFKKSLGEVRKQSKALSYASILVGFFLQRQGEIRFLPEEHEYGDAATLSRFHPKLYVVERGEAASDTVAFVGSNNWTGSGLGPRSDGKTSISNIEVSTLHIGAGVGWTGEESLTGNQLASRVCNTARELYDEGLLLASWTNPSALPKAADATDWTRCDSSLAVEGQEEEDEDEVTGSVRRTDLNISQRVAALLEQMVEQVLGVDDLSATLHDDIFRSESTFGGLVPQRYQFDGATRLQGILRGSGQEPGQRGAFLTDEAGLGKTLIAKMVAANRLADLLVARRDNRSDDPVRLSIVAPARLIGDGGADLEDLDEASGWHAHVLEIQNAVAQIVQKLLRPRVAVEEADLDEEVRQTMEPLEWRVFSISSFSRKLEAEPVDKEAGDYEAPHERLELRDSVVDDLFHVATSELVVVDESHNFRNPDSRATRTFRFCTSLPVPGEDWELLPWVYESREAAELGESGLEGDGRRHRKLLCLSATPFNNRLEDLTTQIGHFGRRQNWELALEKRFDSYTRGQSLLAAVEEAHVEENPLTSSLAKWQSAALEGAEDLDELHDAFETLLQFAHEHFNSGRQLDVDDKKAESRKQKTDRDYARERVSDRGPDYEWAGDRYKDHLEHIFAHAQEWFEHFEEHGHEPGPEDHSAREARARIDSLLTDLVVQRSRARVLRIAAATRDEDITKMFRRPRIPRHPLPLNQPNDDQTKRDASTTFEAEVLGALHRVLEAKTGMGDESPDEDAPTALTLFPYEISVRRGRAGQSGSADQTVRNTFGFQVVNLIKRLQSSPYSFMRTLLRGPLRKALFEVALVERAFEDDNVRSASLPDEFTDDFETCEQRLDYYRARLTDRHYFEEIRSTAQMIGGATRPDERKAAEDDAFYRRFSGCLDDTNQKRDFEEAYNDFREGLLEADSPNGRWVSRLLEDLADAESSTFKDILVALDWAAKVDDGEFFGGASLFKNLYDGLPTRALQLRNDGSKAETLYGAPFPRIRALVRDADLEDNIEDLVTPLSKWLKRRFEQDERILTLFAWMFIQAAVRLHAKDVAPDPNLRGGNRTLIFSEYTDTQEYLLSVLTALVRVLEQEEHTPSILHRLHEKIVDAMLETAEMLERRALDVQNSDSHDEDFTEPTAYEPPVSARWVEAWVDECKRRDYVPLREIAGELSETTGRICSDRAEFLFTEGAITSDESELADSDDIHEARADFDSDQPETTTVADDVVLDAFSPWYQVAPSADPDAENLEDAARRLTRAADRPCHTLFATEVLAEGVNLQECGVVIHYDLPWNPTHLIQRNGRVDRRIFDTYERPEKREKVEATLDSHYGDFRAPEFDAPEQVYHMTVVPVEPALDDEGEERANRVRQILFQKLQAIRALFGLSAWPVVLGAEDAAQVLNGELDYETPGFRRREDLFAGWRLLHEHAGDAEADLRDVDTLSFQLPDRFWDLLREAVTGRAAPGEKEAEETDWPDVQAAAVGTWTPSTPEATPCRSGIEYQGGGVISGSLFLGEENTDQLAPDRMIGWAFDSGGRSQFYPVRFNPDGHFDEHSLLTLKQGEDSDDFTPDAPTALAEDILVELLEVLEGAHAEIAAEEATDGATPALFRTSAGEAIGEWEGHLNNPRIISYADLGFWGDSSDGERGGMERFNLWIFPDESNEEDAQ